ncbi:MAG: YfcE family phosphodiesterase [Planctomycetes bacterium]|nr:YfcE family phosphodiesterase [Planctomycetota bacterium]
MKIGVMSDSHGSVERVKLALEIFDRNEASALIHCGDVGGIPVFDEWVGRDIRFVWGNTDVPDQATLAYLATVGLNAPKSIPLRLELGSKSIQVFHGHEPSFRTAVNNPTVDYIFHGHTHIARDERVGRCRIVNPGALQRAREYTVATVDLARDEVTFHRL